METIVTIKSHYSEDDYSLDGIYKVRIPSGFSTNYKKVISEVGEALDLLKNGEIEDVSDIDFENAFLTESFVKEIWDNIVSMSDCGTSLEYILRILGWDYEKIAVNETFDADYNNFE